VGRRPIIEKWEIDDRTVAWGSIGPRVSFLRRAKTTKGGVDRDLERNHTGLNWGKKA